MATIQTSSNGGISWSNHSTIDMKSTDANAKIMFDEVSPSFNVRRGKGEVIMNPLTSVSSTIRREGAYSYYTRTRRKSDNVIVGQFAARCIGGAYTSQFRHPRSMTAEGSPGMDAELQSFGLSPGSMSSIEQIVLAEALEKASSPDALSLVTLAELNKTASLVSSCVGSLNGMCGVLESLGSTSKSRVEKFNSVLRQMGRLSKKRLIMQFLGTLDKGLRAAASAWLGYRYGVMATIYDIESWIDASQSGPRRARFVARRTTEWSSSDPALGWNIIPNWHGSTFFGPMNKRTVKTRRSTTTAGVLVGTEALTSADRFGVNRIATSVWELIPFSFVLDWLIDAGTRLSAFEGGLYVRPLGSWITHEHRLLYSHAYYWTPTGGSDATYWYECGGMDSGQVIESIVYRVRIPNPRLSPIPQISVKLNNARLTDSVALLSVLSKRFRRASH